MQIAMVHGYFLTGTANNLLAQNLRIDPGKLLRETFML